MTSSILYKNEPVPGLVTVVIPAYNRDHLIAATLKSIREQSYRNWEVIVVEDSSTGKTQQIVEEFGASVDNSVTYLRNAQNMGAAETRNVAFRRARGQYVATLDSDDRWLPHHLETVIATMEESGEDVGYANVMMVEDVTENELGLYGPQPEELAGFPQTLFNRSFVVPSATVMRREVLETVGAWSSEYQFCEDFDYWLRCVSAGVTFVHLDQTNCLYRKGHGGATTEKLASTLEEVSFTILRYRNSPAIEQTALHQYAHDNFLIASRFHRRSDPKQDPSADPLRGGQLLIKAWQLSPSKASLLVRGVTICIREGIRRIFSSHEDRSKYRTPHRPLVSIKRHVRPKPNPSVAKAA